MGKGWILACCMLSLVLLAGGEAFANAKVRGSVTDEHQAPVAHALVFARPTRGPIAGRIPQTTTDARGQFSFDDLNVGSYVIFATTEVAGTSFAYFNVPPWVVELQVGNSDIAGVDVRLSKLARIVTTTIDAGTGKRVTNAKLHVCRVDNPNQCMGAPANWPDPTRGLLIPAMPFKFRVSAPGYQEWRSNGPIELAPDVTKTLMIQLQRASQ